MSFLTGKATVVEEGNKSFIKSQRLTIKSLHDQAFMSHIFMFNEQAQVYI